jgi:hypothetical protein
VQKLTGDFILRARIDFAGQGVNPRCKMGWRVCLSAEIASVFADAFLQGGGDVFLDFRRAFGVGIEHTVHPLKRADVLQLERRGNACMLSAAHNGETFVSVEAVEIDFGEEASVGLFIDSPDPRDRERVIFRDVRISKPAEAGFRPYKDYIGSRLEILDVHTGMLEVVHREAEPFEAPNWMPNGRTIIYNVGGSGPNKGLLRTIDLETRAVAPLETAFAIHNNNDHALSFDGAQLAISHHSPDDDGRSVVYTLPSTGGTPNSPSFLHGWSPDSQWLVYTGGPPKVIAYVYGGQGTINVPSWSPDSRRIAFVSNTGEF